MASDVLQLTGIISAGEQPNTFIGRIKEIGGIVAQGTTEDEAYDNLQETTKLMLEVYKRPQALELLAAQSKASNISGCLINEQGELQFALEKELVA